MITVKIVTGKATTHEDYIKSIKSSPKPPPYFGNYMGLLDGLFGNGSKVMFELKVQFTNSEGQPFKLSQEDKVEVETWSGTVLIGQDKVQLSKIDAVKPFSMEPSGPQGGSYRIVAFAQPGNFVYVTLAVEGKSAQFLLGV